MADVAATGWQGRAYALSMTSDEWRELAGKELRGSDPDSLTWHTPEGIAVEPLYTAEDLSGLPLLARLPGSSPPLRSLPERSDRRTCRRHRPSVYAYRHLRRYPLGVMTVYTPGG